MRCSARPLLVLVALLCGVVASVAPAAAVTRDFDTGIGLEADAASLRLSSGGQQIFVADLDAWPPSTLLPDLPVAGEPALKTWRYPHLRGIAFLEVPMDLDPESRPALRVRTADGFELVRRSIRPHDGTGTADAVTAAYWVRADVNGGGRSWVAVVPLDRATLTRQTDDVVSFDSTVPSNTGTWALAVVTARTRQALQQKIGRAFLTYDGAGQRDASQHWQVPPLCGLCQQQRVQEVELDLRDRGSSLLLRVRAQRLYPEHAAASPEGMSINGHELGPWMSGENGDEAWFVIPMNAPLADALVDVAVNGDALVEAVGSQGKKEEIPTVRVKLDPEFAERLYVEQVDPRDEADWPDHLSSNLISSWPNPFRESTTIEITVPATIGEAFELEDDLLARVNPEDEPPFGTSPSVSVKVYNVSGQLVNVLDQSPRTSGRFTVGWNGLDLSGRPVASGAYYIHVEMEEWSVTRRVLLIRN